MYLLSRHVAFVDAWCLVLTRVLPQRSLDPALGVFTGALAFYLRQTNPRTAPPPEESLSALVSWKLQVWKEERRNKMIEQEEKVMRELAK